MFFKKTTLTSSFFPQFAKEAPSKLGLPYPPPRSHRPANSPTAELPHMPGASEGYQLAVPNILLIKTNLLTPNDSTIKITISLTIIKHYQHIIDFETRLGTD